MDSYAFVVETADGDTVEYRTRRCTATEAVERCRGKYPEGDILRPIQGDFSEVDFDSITRGDSPTESEDTDPAPVTESPPVDPTEMTVSEIEDALDENEYNAAELRALSEAEEVGDERSTALDAIEDAYMEAK